MHNDWRTVLEFSVQPILILRTFVSYRLKYFWDSKIGHCPDTNSHRKTSKMLPFWKPVNGSNTNMTNFSWSVNLIITSFDSFYFICLLGIALIHVMPHHSTAIPMLSPFFPQKQKHDIFFVLLILTFTFAVCVPFAQIRGYSSKICTLSCGVRLKKDVLYNHLCILSNLFRLAFLSHG